MADINQVTITGHLGADPEIRTMQSGSKVANLRVAVSETWRDKTTGDRKERTEWVPVVILNDGLCKVAEQYLRKGSHVFIQGQFTNRKWTDQSGNERYVTEVVLRAYEGKLSMLDKAPQGNGGVQRHERDSYGNNFDDMSDEIPF